MAIDISKDTLQKETDALFWAQTGYKPGQKLDPANPLDKAYGPVWLDIFHKVQRAADAGTLVTTYDHPVVAQHLSDAAVANAAAAAHLDAAVAARNPVVSQENASAATTATQISTQKTREAAANQSPAASPVLVKKAGKEAIKTPPPLNAPSADHIAHGQARVHAHGHHTPMQEHEPSPSIPASWSNEALYKETNARFWRQTGYKPGQKLDQANAQDREKAQIWRAVFRQVQYEAAAGTLVLSSLAPIPYPMPPPPWGVRPMGPRPPMVPPYPQMPPYQPYPQGQAYQPYSQMQQSQMQQPYSQMPLYQPQMQQPQMQQPQMQQPYPPNGHERGRHGQQPYPPNGHERGRHGRGHGRGQHPSSGPLGPQPGGQSPPTDVSVPPGAPASSAPSPGGFPSSEGAPPADIPGAPSSLDTVPSPPPEESSSIGKYLAIGLAIVAGGGLLYYATSHKSPGRTPKVLLATPTRPTSMTALSRP
jgi:hypothetical protein